MTTVTVPTDYATIQEGVNAAASGASEANPGIVNILNGEYEEAGTYNQGLYIRNFVKLIGESRDGVIIYPPAGVANADAVFYPGLNVQHENLTLHARSANNYALHQDHLSDWLTWKNCIFHHEDSGKAAIGGGGRAGQVVTFEDCQVTQGLASVHGDVYSRAVTPDIWEWHLIGCTLPSWTMVDFTEYKDNQVTLQDCTITTVTYTRNTTYYDLYPEDPLFNQGFVRSGIFLIDRHGNTIGSIAGIGLLLENLSLAGQRRISAAGTAERLHPGLVVNSPVQVKALPGNTGAVYIGDTGTGDVDSASGLPLAAGEALIFTRVTDLRNIFVDAAVNNEGVSWMLLAQ